MQKNRCIVCGGCSDEGLSILGNAICPKCENHIMESDAGDAQYGAYVERLLRIARRASRM